MLVLIGKFFNKHLFSTIGIFSTNCFKGLHIFNHKNFKPIWNITFCKIVLWFDILTWTPPFNLGPYHLFIKVNIYAWLYINRFHFNGSVICIVLFIMSSNLLTYTFVDVLKNFVLCRSNKSFSSNRFPFIICWIRFHIIFFKP